MLAFAKAGDRVGAAEVPVLPGKVHECVGDRDEFQPHEFLSPRGADARKPFEGHSQAAGPIRHGHLTVRHGRVGHTIDSGQIVHGRSLSGPAAGARPNQ